MCPVIPVQRTLPRGFSGVAGSSGGKRNAVVALDLTEPGAVRPRLARFFDILLGPPDPVPEPLDRSKFPQLRALWVLQGQHQCTVPASSAAGTEAGEVVVHAPGGLAGSSHQCRKRSESKSTSRRWRALRSGPQGQTGRPAAGHHRRHALHHAAAPLMRRVRRHVQPDLKSSMASARARTPPWPPRSGTRRASRARGVPRSHRPDAQTSPPSRPETYPSPGSSHGPRDDTPWGFRDRSALMGTLSSPGTVVCGLPFVASVRWRRGPLAPGVVARAPLGSPRFSKMPSASCQHAWLCRCDPFR